MIKIIFQFYLYTFPNLNNYVYRENLENSILRVILFKIMRLYYFKHKIFNYK